MSGLIVDNFAGGGSVSNCPTTGIPARFCTCLKCSPPDAIEAAAQFSAPNVFNPWSDSDPMDLPHGGPVHRTRRLIQHFDCPNAKLLLIGEAPGYQGCHFSGVPFTNEALICSGRIPRIPDTDRFTSRPKPWCEPSATIVWSALHAEGIADQVVMWNAFAWHPYMPEDRLSNRTPKPDEVSAGLDVLRLVLARFPGVLVVPVGRVAERALARLNVKAEPALRHPSMGGAALFRVGLAELVRKVAA